MKLDLDRNWPQRQSWWRIPGGIETFYQNFEETWADQQKKDNDKDKYKDNDKDKTDLNGRADEESQVGADIQVGWVVAQTVVYLCNI